MTRWMFGMRRFGKDERGSFSVEFAFYFVALFMLLATGVEMAHMSLRRAMLERAVDLSVRDIRLATGMPPTYEEVRAEICAAASIVGNCSQNLMLEMVQVDPRDFQRLPADAQCRNAQEAPKPVRKFDPGQDNDLMLIRACLKFNPVFPTSGLAARLPQDADGYASLIVTASFVQEPR
ncbi:TadE/TadG family type IV pilus assembly protein [Mesobacterium pallidum]|uniref:TadE/TadG family type IV pilus assembly protein n=1 Tax=Mesobacterium pallidum TaxID=2872037 RepID=UPI001EE34783|nr:pilus assembly protein [Mesobacterium pallidum]